VISRNSINGAYPIKRLGEVVEFLDSKRRPVTESGRRAGPFPYYGANGIQGTIDEFIFDEPLVLLAEDGGHFGEPDRGIAYRISGKTWVNNHAHVLRPTSAIELAYLCRVLENYDVTPFVTGTTRGKLTKAGASEIIIPLPPLAEQRRIAEVLDRAEALRAKRRAALAQLDSLTQSLFLDLFGDPVSNRKDWSRKKFSEVGTLDRGISKNRPRNAPELLDGPYPLVQTGDVANCGGYIRSYQSTYSEIGLKQSKMWPAGTLCITIAANIAKTGILTFNACFPDSIVGFRAEDSATVEFVRSWLSFLQKSLEDAAPESAQKNINLALLRNLAVPLPPISLQREFARRVTAVEALKTAQRASLAELAALFATLQHRAFRGEL
jgi:type I restriction enzyme S subunit